MDPPRVDASSPISEPSSLDGILFRTPQSSPSTSSSFCRQNKRPRSSSRFSTISDSSSSHVPQKVAAWKLYHAERLQIFYSKCYTKSPVDLFTSLDITIQPFTDQQKYYVETIKSLVKFDMPCGLGDLLVYPEVYDKLNLELEETVKKLRFISTNPNENNMMFMYINGVLGQKVYRFVREFSTLLKIFKDKLAKEKVVAEAHFIPICESFAEMCNLTVKNCRVKREWKNLADQIMVSSIPDLHFLQNGKNMNEFPFPVSHIVVSVVEVKKSSCQSSDEAHGSGEEDEGHNKPEILNDLSWSVLGQHAGELLLEIRHNYIQGAGNRASKIMRPGMIIDGTKVFFTLLEMSRDHIGSLQRNKKCTENATIHYTKPLDLNVKEERDILVDSFIMLNNIDFSSLALRA